MSIEHNLFGTDGIRATVGQKPFTLHELPKLGNAIALWVNDTYAHIGNQPTGLIACDTRASCSFVKTALTSSMLLHSITLIDMGVMPTPALCILLKDNSPFHFGIMISASHNPYHDNGIKIIDGIWGKLTPEHEQTISALFDNTPITPSYTQFGSLHTSSDALSQYHHLVTRQFRRKFLDKVTIVLDCAHGAAGIIAPAIFESFGARTITINNTPNGTNINEKCGPLHLDPLIETVKLHNADMGFAFDGDADRVIIINKKGEIKDGDDILALLTSHPLYAHQSTIVGTIMSNQALATYLQERNKQLIRTAVGDKHISAYLNTYNYLLGGEQSGHIIMRDHLNTGDGIFTALRILETTLNTNNMLLNTFTKYPQVLINIPVSEKKNLHEKPYSDIIKRYAHDTMPGRLEVRYSGTENVLRIMIECSDNRKASHIGNNIAHELQKEFALI